MNTVHANIALALSLWAGWRAPLVALAAGLLASLAGRALRVPMLAAAAGGIGAAAGLYALAGFAWPVAGISQRLAPIAAAATVAALLGQARWPRAGIVGAALLGGWFLAGAPQHPAPLLPWIETGGVAAVLAVGALGLGGLGAGQVVLASVSLACALSVARAGHPWVLAALVPGAAMVGGLASLIQPSAMAVAAVAAACVLSADDLQHLRLRPIEAAAAAPVLALFLAARLAPRLRIVAGGVGVAAATLVVWMIAGGR